MVIMPGRGKVMSSRGKGETQLIRRLRGQKNETERKKEFVLFISSSMANTTDAFCLLGVVYCLCYFFAFSFSPCACLYQIWLKIFRMCLYCKPSYFSRDLVWWRSSYFFSSPRVRHINILATHFRGQWKMCS